MTSIEKLFEQLEEQGIVFKSANNLLHISIDASDYLDIKRLAKEMHKQEIIDAYVNGQSLGFDDSPNYMAEQYYQETFVSKGSGDTLKDYHIVDTNELINQVPDIRKMVEDDVEIKNMFDLPTAEEFLDNYRAKSFYDKSVNSYYIGAMLEFSKIHVQDAVRRTKETLYTEEQTLEFAKWLASNWIPLYVEQEYMWEYDELDLSKIPENYRGYKTEKQLFDIFQSLKQPKKD